MTGQMKIRPWQTLLLESGLDRVELGSRRHSGPPKDTNVGVAILTCWEKVGRKRGSLSSSFALVILGS